MANWSRMSYARLVSAAHTLYTNARANPDIVAEMTEFGYTAPDDYDAGIALVTAFEAATAAQSAEYADQYAATTDYHNRNRTSGGLHLFDGLGQGALHLVDCRPD